MGSLIGKRYVVDREKIETGFYRHLSHRMGGGLFEVVEEYHNRIGVIFINHKTQSTLNCKVNGVAMFYIDLLKSCNENVPTVKKSWSIERHTAQIMRRLNIQIDKMAAEATVGLDFKLRAVESLFNTIGKGSVQYNREKMSEAGVHKYNLLELPDGNIYYSYGDRLVISAPINGPITIQED